MDSFYQVVGRDADTILWWQMVNRGILILVYAIAVYRAMPARAFSNSAVLDIVVTVIVGSALGRALTANAPLLPTLAATAALMSAHVLLSVLTRYSRAISRIVKGRPVQLVRAGQIDWKMMRRVQLGERDLLEQLRLNGVGSLDQVAEAYMERNGAVSVIKAED